MQDPSSAVVWLVIIAGIVAVALIRYRQNRADERRRQQAREAYEQKRQEQAKAGVLEDIDRYFPFLRSFFRNLIEAGAKPEEAFGRAIYNIDAIDLGTTFYDLPARLPIEERRKHLYVVGKTGSGKTSLLLHLIKDDLEEGRGVGIIAPEAELFRDWLLPMIPEERGEEVIYFAPGNPKNPVTFNPLAVENGDDRGRASEDLFTIFKRAVGEEEFGARMSPILANAFACLTGWPEVLAELAQAKPAEVELIGAQSARLVWELITLHAREAQRIEKAETIRRMAGGVFHGLGNLLTALHGRAALLRRALEQPQGTTAELAEGLDLIARTATHTREILSRLRMLTRDAAGRPVTPVEVNGLIREVVTLTDPLRREALVRSVSIDLAQALGEVPPVLGRSAELIEVLLNLIVNAIEAMPEGGTLTLETACAGTDALIRVADTGVGIPEAVRAKLFTPFFTTKSDGTGLGLSVSREILRRHGGDLEVESVEGKGTGFTIRLPALVEAGAPFLGLLGRVLVVDDDPVFREILVTLLTGEGYPVSGAAGGKEAQSSLERHAYDLVVADIVLPDVLGWEVARVARMRNPGAVVILFSGAGLHPEGPALRDIGADAFLMKPFRLAELVEAVRRVLAARVQPAT